MLFDNHACLPSGLLSRLLSLTACSSLGGSFVIFSFRNDSNDASAYAGKNEATVIVEKDYVIGSLRLLSNEDETAVLNTYPFWKITLLTDHPFCNIFVLKQCI